MSCSHPDGAITDYAVHSSRPSAIEYAWRGACSSCRHAVLGVTALPFGLPEPELLAALTADLMAYLARAALQSGATASA